MILSTGGKATADRQYLAGIKQLNLAVKSGLTLRESSLASLAPSDASRHSISEAGVRWRRREGCNALSGRLAQAAGGMMISVSRTGCGPKSGRRGRVASTLPPAITPGKWLRGRGGRWLHDRVMGFTDHNHPE